MTDALLLVIFISLAVVNTVRAFDANKRGQLALSIIFQIAFAVSVLGFAVEALILGYT